jgi:hypothetical protein
MIMSFPGDHAAFSCLKAKRPGVGPTSPLHLDDPRRYIRGRGSKMKLIGCLRGLQVLGSALAAAAVLDDLERDLLAFRDGAHAGTLDSGDVDENVRAAIVGSDEAVALGRVEELHGSGVHDDFLSIGHSKKLAAPKHVKRFRSILREEDRRPRVTRQKVSSTSKIDMCNIDARHVRNKARQK